LSGVFALPGENTRQLHKLGGGSFKLVFACGDRSGSYHFLFFVFALCERENENDRKKIYRSAEGYDCIRYATA